MPVVIIWRTSKVVFAGFACCGCCVCTGLSLITGAVVTCARAEIARAHRTAAATSNNENRLLSVIEGNLQRFQESQILRRHLEFWRLPFFRKNFLIDLNVQGLEKSPVGRSDFRVFAVATRQADGR